MAMTLTQKTGSEVTAYAFYFLGNIINIICSIIGFLIGLLFFLDAIEDYNPPVGVYLTPILVIGLMVWAKWIYKPQKA